MKQPIRILVVDDEESFREVLKNVLQSEGYETFDAADGVAAINALQANPYDLVLLDVNMPGVNGMEVLKHIKSNVYGCEVIMLTGVNEIQIAIESVKLGAYDYLLKPYSDEVLLTSISRAVERRKLIFQNIALKTELARRAASSKIISQNPEVLDVLRIAMKAAPTETTVLIHGESGTGKELIANYIHSNSLRKEQPFIVLNCAAIQETLLESELFGHEKGAFTDASKEKQGLVEVTNGGTLFLDEIGEISPVIQPKLLRFLQNGEYIRVGGTRVLKSDVRILAATNRDLNADVKNGRFREDLFYRINIITLDLPPLRKRKEDIPFLIDNFIKKRAGEMNVWKLDDSVVDTMQKYDWPGNIRELENVLERAMIIAEDNTIRLADLSISFNNRKSRSFSPESTENTLIAGYPMALSELEKAHISGVLKSVNWDKKLAAKILDINLKTLYLKIQTYDLKRDS